MGNLSGALQQLRAERKQAQARVESIDQAISVIESLNGSGKVSQASRARWAKARKESHDVGSGPKEDRRVPTRTVGEVEGRKESCLM
jgi:hypothetical protein